MNAECLSKSAPQDFVFDDLSYTNKNDIAVGLNTAFNEIIWYYASANATPASTAPSANANKRDTTFISPKVVCK